jgi:glucose/arabinose dehydrogenase
LLGLAFSPAFVNDKKVFMNYVRTVDVRVMCFADIYRVKCDIWQGQLQTVISEFTENSCAEAKERACIDVSTERQLLIVNQPYSNHKGGWVSFGGDGLLYLSLGDGGSANNPGNTAHNKSSLLGKILRIDVFSAEPYGIPTDNPFVSTPGARGEIYADGLR